MAIMAEEIKQRTMNTRISHKHDTPENWAKAKATDTSSGFIPCAGELIIYDKESSYNSVAPHRPNIKIGDGASNVTELPFLIYPEFIMASSAQLIDASYLGMDTIPNGTRILIDASNLSRSTSALSMGIKTSDTKIVPIEHQNGADLYPSALNGNTVLLEYSSAYNAFLVIQCHPRYGSFIGNSSVSTRGYGFSMYTSASGNNLALMSTDMSSGICHTTCYLRGNSGVALSYSGSTNILNIYGTVFGKSGSTAAIGMVPAPPTTAGTSLFLREDGTWASPSTSTLGALSVGSASKPVYFSNGTPVEANRIPTIRTGNSIPDGTVGEDGDMFIVTHANRLPRIYSGTEEPDYSIGVNGDIYIRYS